LTPASISPDPTAWRSRPNSFHDSVCQASPFRWWKSARSPYFLACRKKTPTVVLGLIVSGSIRRTASVVVAI